MRTRCLIFCGFLNFFLSQMNILAEEIPTVLHLGLVAPDLLGITLQDGQMVPGEQIPYQPEAGDALRDEKHSISIYRDEKFLGWLVGKSQELLYTEDQVKGKMTDPAWLDDNQSYRIQSSDDPNFSEGLLPLDVYRKTKPSDFARWHGWPYQAPLRHVIYLKLPHPLKAGKSYRIEFQQTGLAPQTFRFDPASLRSEAVHVSQLGFRPDDPVKVAFLSCWLGSGGAVDYQQDLNFWVSNAQGERVMEGKVQLSKKVTEPEDAYKINYNGTDVYKMDFSNLKTLGTYRVWVDGIGCSYPFEVSENAWRDAFRVSVRGFYHQRSGIELGPPFTGYIRPRTFHPDDGLKVFHSATTLMDSKNGLNARGQDKNNFYLLVKGKTDEIVPNAWGGYMDAGDWDRRIQHLIVSRYLLELVEMFPSETQGLTLNIPESGNDLSDLVDEALFNLDFYRRLQSPEGGIRGGIESAEHPRHGEASWQESLDVMAYAPGVWSSFVYAGGAAQAAFVLMETHPDLSGVYAQSALRAMQWAEAHYDQSEKLPHDVRDDRNLAAVELYRLTGDEQWHRIFQETTVFTTPGETLFEWKKHHQRHAPWVYVRTAQPGVDKDLQALCRAAVLREADNRKRNGEQSGFGWAKYEWQPGMWGVFSAPDGISLARAHYLTKDLSYLKALVLACQTGAGANPVNICYTTGLGQQSPQHPLHVDSRITRQTPPPGLTVSGPIDVARHQNYWAQKVVSAYSYPEVQRWPTLEAFWDVFWYPPVCEFTVQNPMAANAFAWGYLAFRPKEGQ